MSKSKINIIGIGCDFQSENEVTRKIAIENLSGGEQSRIKWMTSYMSSNKAFKYSSVNKSKSEKKELLKQFNKAYINYRKNWKNQPIESFKYKLYGQNFRDKNKTPLCFDIEVASICDLACAFCYRQYIATPDKIMKKELAFKLIEINDTSFLNERPDLTRQNIM